MLLHPNLLAILFDWQLTHVLTHELYCQETSIAHGLTASRTKNFFSLDFFDKDSSSTFLTLKLYREVPSK
jgi:hypothetical protein